MSSPVSRTPFVLLGLLSFEPMSGYDLKATIERTVGHFWQESYGQIYPALKRLHADGLIERVDRSPSARRRKVYGITDAGRARFRAWLDEAATASLVRNEVLLKVFFASLADEALLCAHLTDARERARQQRGMLEGIRAAIADEPATEHQRRCWLLTVDLGLRNAAAAEAWANDALALLENA